MNSESQIVRKEPLIKPQGSGLVSRLIFIGAGVGIAYTTFTTAPFLAATAIGFVGLSFLREIAHIQDPRKSKLLEDLLNSHSVKHPSIWEQRKELRMSYSNHLINKAIEAMLYDCDTYYFKASSSHPYRGLGELYCWKCPEDGTIMLPLDGLYKLFSRWGVEPAIDVDAPTVVDEQPLLIGANTQLNAINVDALPVADGFLPANDIRAMPLVARADYIIGKLTESGCDVRLLVNRPTLACGGLQRSGKSTLIQLISILEMAKGQEVVYISRDNDVPPVAFKQTYNGSKAVAIAALDQLNQRIQKASMGSLTGKTFILDEFLACVQELDAATRDQLWKMVLTGFAKQGARVRLITHAKTASANMLPKGMAETFKAEVKLLWTDRNEDESGYSPSGLYTLMEEVEGFYRESATTLQIPDWLLSEVNPQWHNKPCPVRSLLVYFPEFKAVAMSSIATEPGAVDQRAVIGSPAVTPQQPDAMTFEDAIAWFESQIEPEEMTVNLAEEDNEIVDFKVLKALEKIVLTSPTDSVTIASIVKAVEGNSKKRPELIQHVLEHIKSCKPEWAIDSVETHNGTSYSVRLANIN